MTNGEQMLRDLKLAVDSALAQYRWIDLYDSRLREANKVIDQIRNAINIHGVIVVNPDKLSGFERDIIDIINRYDRRMEEERNGN